MIDDPQMTCYVHDLRAKDVLDHKEAEALQVGEDAIKLHVSTSQSAEGAGIVGALDTKNTRI